MSTCQPVQPYTSVGHKVDLSAKRKADRSVKRKADMSSSHEQVPAASAILPPTSITCCVTQASTTAATTSSSSASPPNAATGPSKPLQRSQTSSSNAVATSLKLPPTDLGMVQHQEPAAHRPVVQGRQHNLRPSGDERASRTAC
jgi:hypothetical protein